MAIVKYSTCSLIDVSTSTNELSGSSGIKISAIVDRVDPAFVYSVVRGIQGDVFNENNDMWGWERELLMKRASDGLFTWQTWIGKPVCVQHKSDRPEDHFGKVLDAWPNNEEKTVYMLLGTNSKLNPKLAEAVRSGIIDKVSMGCVVKYSNCTYCGNIAHTIHDYCDHLKYHKGRVLPVNDGLNYLKEAMVDDHRVRVGEDCHESTGIEMSWVVNPAFPACTQVELLKAASSPTPSLKDQYQIIGRLLMRSSKEQDRKAGKVILKAASKDVITEEEKEALNILFSYIGILED